MFSHEIKKALLKWLLFHVMSSTEPVSLNVTSNLKWMKMRSSKHKNIQVTKPHKIFKTTLLKNDPFCILSCGLLSASSFIGAIFCASEV